MISVTINGVPVEVKDLLSYERNILEERDFATISVFNDRSLRYETYDKVVIDIEGGAQDGFREQYLVQTDTVTAQRAGLYEHELILMEVVAFFDTLYPADRSFRRPGQTLEDILNVYKRELEHYNNVVVDFVGDGFDALIPEKEFVGVNMSVILTDLFRRIDAVTKSYFFEDKWFVFPQFFNYKNQLITNLPFSETQQINNIDYATKVKSQVKNGVYEQAESVWFPSATGYVTPRSEDLIFSDSKLRYELDSPIIAVEKFEIVDLEYIDLDVDPNNVITVDSLDITSQVITDVEYERLNTLSNLDIFLSDLTVSTDNARNHIVYTPGSPYIGPLFQPPDNNLLGIISNDLLLLKNAILRVLYKEFGREMFINLNTEDIKARVKYKRQRDLDITHHRQYVGVMNESATIHNQRDSAIEVSQYKKSLRNLANRMGNVKITGTRIFDYTERVYQVGDYTEDGLTITRVKNTIHNDNYFLCEYELSENFANVQGEYAISREPFPYSVSQRLVTTNLIDENYVVISEEFFGFGGRLTSDAFKGMLKMFSSDTTGVNKIQFGIFKPGWVGWFPDEAIHMPVLAGGDGNTLTFHVYFQDIQHAGKSKVLVQDSIFSILNDDSNFQNWIKYTDNDARLEDFKLYFTPDIGINDTGDYPKITNEQPFLDNALTLTNSFEPLDKDAGANFAFTYAVHFVTRHKHIVIGEALSRNNYLIVDPPSEHDFEVYKSPKTYNIYDQKPRSFDEVAQVSYTFNLTQGKLTFAASEDVEHFALVKNGDILLAFNRPLQQGEAYSVFVTLSRTPQDFSAQELFVPRYVTNAPYYGAIQSLVIFRTNGGVPVPDNINAQTGDVIQEPVEKPVKENSVFIGWDVGFPYTVVDQQTIINAVYQEVDVLDAPAYTSNAPYYDQQPAIVTFDAAGATPEPAEYYGLIGDVINEPTPEPTRDGFIFRRWDVTFPFTIQQTLTTIRAELLLIKQLKDPEVITNAPYYLEPNDVPVFYTVTFDYDGGSPLFDPRPFFNLSPGTVINNPGDASKTGFVFFGWDTTFPITVNSDLTITAIYQEVVDLASPTYVSNAPYYLAVNDLATVTFLDYDGTVLETQDVIIGEDAVIDDPTRTGYTFTGWDQDITNVTTDFTTTAQYNAVNYVINYVMNGGTNSSSNPTTYTIEDTPFSIVNPNSRTGYTFGGWSPSSNVAEGTTGELTFIANWNTIQYSITYTLNGGTNNPSNPSSYNIEDTPISLADASRSDYCFTTWSPVSTIPSGSTGNKAFSAGWTPRVTLSAPFRDTSLPTSTTWEIGDGPRIDTYAEHNNDVSISLRVTLYDLFNGQWYTVTSQTKTVGANSSAQFTFDRLLENTTYAFGYQASKSGCYTSATVGRQSYTITTPNKPQYATPTTFPVQSTQDEVVFGIRNNDNDIGGYVQWKIREGSTSGTVVESGRDFLSKNGDSGDEEFVSANQFDGVQSSTTYYLTDVFMEDGDKAQSNNGSIRAITTDSLPQTTRPAIINPTSTSSTIGFDLRNDDGTTATIRYELTDDPDNFSGSVSVGPGLTAFRSFTNLNADQTYKVTADALASGKERSPVRDAFIKTQAVYRVRLGIEVSDGTTQFTNIIYQFSDFVSDNVTVGTGTPTTVRSDTPGGTAIIANAPQDFTDGGTTYTFVEWQVNGAGQTSGDTEVETTINSNTDLIAVYAAFGF